MRELSPGWATDLAVFQYGGSTVEDRDDYLIVRTPNIPDFHWGHCIFVLDEAAINDAQRWVATFHETFPDARWIAIGLVAMPEDSAAWVSAGLELELDDVLTTDMVPRQTPLPDGYTVRQLQGADWEQRIMRSVAENLVSGKEDPASYERFMRAKSASQQALCDSERAAFFGAFAGEELVADLGIVRCGQTARYQSVGTSTQHRRRGLAAHLLGVAARWAGDRGCNRWVIITESTNAAGRVYRSVGFEPDVGNAQAYRAPAWT